MTTRKATTHDVDAIHELGKSVDEFAVNSDTVTFWPKELLAHAVQSEDVLMLVAEVKAGQEAAEENGAAAIAVIGFLIVNYNNGLKKALIENIYVRPDKRGQGVGDALLKHLFELLPGMGCEYIATLVPPDAAGALELYTRNGFARGETFVWLDKTLDERFKKTSEA